MKIKDLIFSRSQRCRCGSGLAVVPGKASWQCAALLLDPESAARGAEESIADFHARVVDAHDPIYPMHNHPFPSEKDPEPVKQADGTFKPVFSSTRP